MYSSQSPAEVLGSRRIKLPVLTMTSGPAQPGYPSCCQCCPSPPRLPHSPRSPRSRPSSLLLKHTWQAPASLWSNGSLRRPWHAPFSDCVPTATRPVRWRHWAGGGGEQLPRSHSQGYTAAQLQGWPWTERSQRASKARLPGWGRRRQQEDLRKTSHFCRGGR